MVILNYIEYKEGASSTHKIRQKSFYKYTVAIMSKQIIITEDCLLSNRLCGLCICSSCSSY